MERVPCIVIPHISPFYILVEGKQYSIWQNGCRITEQSRSLIATKKKLSETLKYNLDLHIRDYRKKLKELESARNEYTVDTDWIENHRTKVEIKEEDY